MKRLFILLADIGGFYASLILTLIIRYWSFSVGFYLKLNILPFSLLLILWLVIFYSLRLYDFHNLKNAGDFFATVQKAFIFSAIISIVFFYIAGSAFNQVTPKTNLLIFLITYDLIFSASRYQINKSLSRARVEKILFLISQENEEFKELKSYLDSNPQLGYQIKVIKTNPGSKIDLENTIKQEGVNILVMSEVNLSEDLTELVLMGIEVFDLKDFYGKIFHRVKVTNESEFISLVSKRKNSAYEAIKRLIDIIICFIVGFILIPVFFIPIVLLIKIDSPGPIFYKEKRVGRGGKVFQIYKFRTMIKSAKENGPAWTLKDDSRVTKVGKVLRRLHIDEWPQAWAVVANKMSLVGPRAESLEIFEKAKEVLPLIRLRHLIKPGITGWAQINYRPSASLQELEEKLEFDLYYIKNRSLLMDLAIILQTLRQVL